MSGAHAAAGRGITSVQYNPSSITHISGTELYYTQSKYIAGITKNVLGYGLRLSPNDYLGMNLFYLNSGDIGVTTTNPIVFNGGTGVTLSSDGIEFDGSQNISIDGLAFSHADITNFINNLNEKSLIEQANLLSAKALEQSEQSTSNKMGFTILCKLKDV